MRATRRLLRAAATLAALAAAAAPAGATTLVRAGLDRLVEQNETVVVGEVLGARSYWNEERTMILTDVRFRAREVLKGGLRHSELTLTLLGGSVDGETVWIVGNAELALGKTYVLFLHHNDLPGAPGALTVRHYCQGVFEVIKARDGLRAVSQAVALPLQADALGFVDPPGKAAGLPLAALRQSIRDLAGRPTSEEVQP